MFGAYPYAAMSQSSVRDTSDYSDANLTQAPDIIATKSKSKRRFKRKARIPIQKPVRAA